MAKLPNPPSLQYLQSIQPVTKTIKKGTEVARIFFAGGHYPTTWDSFRYYGPVAGRFDHHEHKKGQPYSQSRGVMYLAAGLSSIPTSLAEVFQATRIIDRHHNSPVLTVFKLTSTLTLLDLSGPFCTTIGASTAIHSGPRPKAQRWAKQLYEACPNIDGLLYCSSMYGNAPAIALFERGIQAMPSRPLFHRSLNDPALQQVINATGAKIRYAVV